MEKRSGWCQGCFAPNLVLFMAFVDPTAIAPMSPQLEESVPAFQVFQESSRGNSELGSF